VNEASNASTQSMKPIAAAAALAISVVFAPFATAQDFDIVINNGRVMDPETKFDKVSNVGIKDGKIVKITTKKNTGKETVDAKGYVVAPGFIDTHTHSSNKFAIKMSMMDGVTTGLDLEAAARIRLHCHELDSFLCGIT